jgi:pyruvate formate lyase activating enzyme
MSAERGLVLNIQRFCVHDGPGIRTTVFLKGCPLACPWCHNPEAISSRPQIVVVETRCIACGACVAACPLGLPSGRGGGFAGERAPCTACGACVEACPTEARQLAGQELSVAEVMGAVARDRVFYEESQGGVTFSGGEPLRQPRFLIALLRACREQGIDTALDTSGLAPREELLAAAALADLVLFDLKLIDDERHREQTGVSNRTILANLRALAGVHRRLWIRVPVLPGVNDDAENLAATAAFVASLPRVERVSLLAYHKLGQDKLRRLGQTRAAAEIVPPSALRMRALATDLEAAGVPVTIG